MSGEYKSMGGGLKLKGGLAGKKKKKKKSKLSSVSATAGQLAKGEKADKVEKGEKDTEEYNDLRTPAQRKFDEVQAEREKGRIIEKAKLTHKEKVDNMNQHLATLSEHYDVPKVSWTK
eukprot:gene9341-29259_t